MGSEIEDLIARVEKATGPSFELDVRIGCWRVDFPVPPGENVHWGLLSQSVNAQPVTASLDSALALVEEKLPGRYWYICAGRARVGEPLYGAQITDHAADGVSFDEPMGIAEHEHSAPLAVLLALLRALHSQGDKP